MATAASSLVQTRLDGGNNETGGKAWRKSYSRETKLDIISFYHVNARNLYQTAKKFSLNTKTILRWLKDEENIRESKKCCRRVKLKCRGRYPDVEERLYDDLKQLRRKGLKVKGWWFRVGAKQMLTEQHPEAVFQSQTRGLTGSRSVITSVYSGLPTLVKGLLITTGKRSKYFIVQFEEWQGVMLQAGHLESGL